MTARIFSSHVYGYSEVVGRGWREFWVSTLQAHNQIVDCSENKLPNFRKRTFTRINTNWKLPWVILPCTSTRIKSCATVATYLQHQLKGVQIGEQKWGFCALGKN